MAELLECLGCGYKTVRCGMHQHLKSKHRNDYITKPFDQLVRILGKRKWVENFASKERAKEVVAKWNRDIASNSKGLYYIVGPAPVKERQRDINKGLSEMVSIYIVNPVPKKEA